MVRKKGIRNNEPALHSEHRPPLADVVALKREARDVGYAVAEYYVRRRDALYDGLVAGLIDRGLDAPAELERIAAGLRRARIARMSPVELDDAEMAYVEAFELAEAYREHLDQLRDAIGDVEAGR